jgi:two-component system CheB/CheR fusion protein
MAFVVVTHALRNAPTRLPRLLNVWSGMPAELARSGMVLSPNHIYVIPPGKEISICGASL